MLYLQSWTKVLGTVLQYSYFLLFLGSLLKQCSVFEIFLQFSLPPPYTKLKLGKNSGYTRPTLYVGCGKGLDLCELENAPETQKCPKTFVHDCRLYTFFLNKEGCDDIGLSNQILVFTCVRSDSPLS